MNHGECKRGCECLSELIGLVALHGVSKLLVFFFQSTTLPGPILNFSLKFRNSSGLPALRLLGGEELTLELLNYLLKERHLLYGVRYLSTCFVIFRDALRGRRLR